MGKRSTREQVKALAKQVNELTRKSSLTHIQAPELSNSHDRCFAVALLTQISGEMQEISLPVKTKNYESVGTIFCKLRCTPHSNFQRVILTPKVELNFRLKITPFLGLF